MILTLQQQFTRIFLWYENGIHRSQAHSDIDG